MYNWWRPCCISVQLSHLSSTSLVLDTYRRTVSFATNLRDGVHRPQRQLLYHLSNEERIRGLSIKQRTHAASSPPSSRRVLPLYLTYAHCLVNRRLLCRWMDMLVNY